MPIGAPPDLFKRVNQTNLEIRIRKQKLIYGVYRGPEHKGYRKRNASDTKNNNLKSSNRLRKVSLVKIPKGGKNRAGKTKTNK